MFLWPLLLTLLSLTSQLRLWNPSKKWTWQGRFTNEVGTTGNSHGALEVAQPPVEDRPSWPWQDRERWIAAPGEWAVGGQEQGRPWQQSLLETGIFWLKTCLVGVVSSWMMMDAVWMVTWAIIENQVAPSAGDGTWMTVWQGAETGPRLATLLAAVTSTVQISTRWEQSWQGEAC